MQKLTEDKGLVSKCEYRSRLVLVELTVGIRFCESNYPYYKICLHYPHLHASSLLSTAAGLRRTRKHDVKYVINMEHLCIHVQCKKIFIKEGLSCMMHKKQQ